MVRTYCPNTHADACPCGGSSSWGTPMRLARFHVALHTLDALGLVDWDARTFVCPLSQETLPFGSPTDVDRTYEGECYRAGGMVLVSSSGNARRNTYGDPDTAWTASYRAAVERAGATTRHPSHKEAVALWALWKADRPQAAGPLPTTRAWER